MLLILDNSFSVTSWSENPKLGVRTLTYKVSHTGTTENGTITYKIHYSKDKTYTDPGELLQYPSYKVEILDGGDNLPELLYRAYRNIARGYFINEVLQFTNPEHLWSCSLEQ